jgi:hypothetical protein
MPAAAAGRDPVWALFFMRSSNVRSIDKKGARTRPREIEPMLPLHRRRLGDWRVLAPAASLEC